jgi:hypothetical protein
MSDPGRAYEKPYVIKSSFGDRMPIGDGGGGDGMDRRVTRLELQQEMIGKELASISAKIDGLASSGAAINVQLARMPTYGGLWSALGIVAGLVLAVLAIVIAVFQYKSDLVTVTATPAAPPSTTVIVVPQQTGVPSLTLPPEPQAEKPAP